MSGLDIRERPSPNHDSRGEVIAGTPRIDMLVLHYTGMQSGAAALDRLCDPEARVSSHYVVEEDGSVWRDPAADLQRRRGRGVGVIERAAALSDLARIGYEVEPGNESPALAAFQRRYRPERWDGRLDGETAGRLAEVRELVDAVLAVEELAKRDRFRSHRRVN